MIPNLKGRSSYPMVKVGGLAVNRDYAGEGFGIFILDDNKYMVLNIKRLVCRVIIVDAYKKVQPFYKLIMTLKHA